MMAITIPAELRRETRDLVDSFFDEGGHRARRR
jgi:hypothetical protein